MCKNVQLDLFNIVSCFPREAYIFTIIAFDILDILYQKRMGG